MKKAMIIALAIFILAGTAYALDKLTFYRNYAGDQTFAIAQGYVNTYLLVANTHKAVTPPTGANYAVFSSTDDLWVCVGGTAAIPAGDTADGTGSELNPSIRYIGGETTIGLKSAAAAKVSITYYE
jgi:hypothetical protein